MSALNGKLLSTTIIPALMGVGGIIAVTTVAVPVSMMTLKPAAAACNPCAAKKPKNACNPCAAKKACGACNPCAAKKACGACNPCAAKNPCAANACNPCAAKKSSSNCVVPSVHKAAACNPCAAKKPCGACNPCGAKSACGACNPCAAKKACGACNPCAAKKACGACNPCAAKKACGACNPCAAKKVCNPCNPCAAKNPCAANACNPCNPCNPCGPCGAAAVADVELEPAEANAAYDCLNADMKNSYAKSGVKEAGYYMDWKIFSTAPYASGTHGGRHVSNYANAVAEEAYALYEEGGKMPMGSMLAKDSFAVQTDGRAVVGPLFMMEKMAAGFNKASGNWKYTLILPNGQTVGTTNGKGSGAVTFCYECHMAAEDTDSLFFLPEEVRVN